MIISFQQWRDGKRIDEMRSIREWERPTSGYAQSQVADPNAARTVDPNAARTVNPNTVNPNNFDVSRNRVQGLKSFKTEPPKITAFGANLAHAFMAIENAKPGDARKLVNRILSMFNTNVDDTDVNVSVLKNALIQGIRAFPEVDQQM